VAANTEIDPKIRKGLAEDLRASEGDKADIDVWLDRELQIRKYAQTGHDQDGDYTMSLTFSRFGEDFGITAPPKGQVQDTKELGKVFAQQMKDAAKKARAKYKTEAEFQKACRAAEKRYSAGFGSAAADTPPRIPSESEQGLMMACSSAEAPF
jgi:hypothetical protein